MKRVNPKVYTTKYYLDYASGFNEFKNTYGKILEPRFERLVKEIPSVKGLRVLDIGCGRGELVQWAVRNGAIEAIGIDYSKSAINLSNMALLNQNNNIKNRVKFVHMDAKNLDFKDKSFDAIFMTEVLEHIYPEEQNIIFKKMKLILKDNGFVFIHTAPSKWFNNFAYKYWCYPVGILIINMSNFLTGNKYQKLERPCELRPFYHKIMHVNEPDYFNLKKLFKNHGFYGYVGSTNITINKPVISWKDKIFNFFVYLYPLSTYFPFNILWGNDFIAVLRKRE